MSLDKGLVQLGSFGDGLALAGTLGAAKVGERERENRIVMEVLNCSRSCRHSSAVAVGSLKSSFFFLPSLF